MYLIYLIVTVSIGSAPFPLISIILIAAVYGLQALIFIIKREFMLVGWMVVYILSYPVYSFLLPVYSFWRMDDFGWGNTRLVIGEGNNKKVLINEDEKFDDSMIPLKKFSGTYFTHIVHLHVSDSVPQNTRPRHGRLARLPRRTRQACPSRLCPARAPNRRTHTRATTTVTRTR